MRMGTMSSTNTCEADEDCITEATNECQAVTDCEATEVANECEDTQATKQRYIPIKLHTWKTTPGKLQPISLKGAGIQNS